MQFKLSMVILIAGALMLSVAPVEAAENERIRIGYVQVRDQPSSVEDPTMLNRLLSRRLRASGFETVELAFQLPAELEEAARRAGCQYVLYTEVLEVRRPFLRNLLPTKAQHVEVTVEFRLFGMDETFPRVSTVVTGRGKALRPSTATALSSGLTVRSLDNPIAIQTGQDVEDSESAAMRAAFRAAFEKQARLAGDGIRHGIVRPADVE